jgi:ABC-type multidrug transport system fused ATPase/permease subunit
MLKFISRLLRFSGQDAWKLKASAAISFVEGILANFPVYAALLVIMKIMDGTLTAGYAWTAFLMVLASLAVRWALRYSFVRMQSDAACRVAARERVKIGDLFKRFPMSYFTDGNIGNVASVITGDLSFADDYGMTKLTPFPASVFCIFMVPLLPDALSTPLGGAGFNLDGIIFYSASYIFCSVKFNIVACRCRVATDDDIRIGTSTTDKGKVERR